MLIMPFIDIMVNHVIICDANISLRITKQLRYQLLKLAQSSTEKLKRKLHRKGDQLQQIILAERDAPTLLVEYPQN